MTTEENNQPQEKPEGNKEIYTLGEITKLAGEEPDYLIEPILSRVGTSVLAAKPDVGKSQLARQLSLAIISGHDEFLGFKLKTLHKRVLYVATEDHPVGISFPLKKQSEGFKDYDENSLVFLCADTMSPEEISSKIHEQLKKNQVDLVVIDSFGDVFLGLDMNNNAMMRNVAKNFDVIAKKYKCNVLFIHHINKSSYDKSPHQKDIQGGSGLLQRIRSALFLSDGRGSFKYLSVVKGNYTPKELKSKAFELEFCEETFTFTFTGNIVPLEQVGQMNHQSIEIDREKLVEIAEGVCGDKKLTHKELIEKLREKTSQSESSAKRLLRTLLNHNIVSKTDEGYGFVPIENNSAEITYSIEPDNPNNEEP